MGDEVGHCANELSSPALELSNAGAVETIGVGRWKPVLVAVDIDEDNSVLTGTSDPGGSDPKVLDTIGVPWETPEVVDISPDGMLELIVGIIMIGAEDVPIDGAGTIELTSEGCWKSVLVEPAGDEGDCSTLDGICKDGKGREDSAGGGNCEVLTGGTGNTIETAEDEADGAGTTELT